VNEERFIKFGFKGLSDIIGMLKDGRFLAVEIKRPGGKLTTNQREFLTLVAHAKGVAFRADSVNDCERYLNGNIEPNGFGPRKQIEQKEK